jgi:Tol biopolymer transport system component
MLNRNHIRDMKYFSKLLILILFIPYLGQAQGSLDTLSLESIFYEPLLAGNRPDFTSFSPDLSHVYYQSNDSSLTKEKLYEVDLNGKNIQLAADKVEERFRVSPNGQELLYTDKGDIWLADLNFNNKHQLTDSELTEYDATWSPDGKRIAFIQEGNAWIINTGKTKLTQVTTLPEDETAYSIIGWAGNNRLMLSQYDTSEYKEYYFPEYLGQYVDPGSTRRGVAHQTISVAHLDSSSVDQLYEKKGYLDNDVSASGRYLAIDAMDAPMKQREIKIYDTQQSQWQTVFQDSTEGWFSGTEIAFAPEGDKLMFQSEQDGWNHIYTVNPDGSNLKQHTSGDYEVPWVEWTGANTLVFASTEVDPGERHIYTLDIQNNRVSKLKSKTGYRQAY